MCLQHALYLFDINELSEGKLGHFLILLPTINSPFVEDQEDWQCNKKFILVKSGHKRDAASVEPSLCIGNICINQNQTKRQALKVAEKSNSR